MPRPRVRPRAAVWLAAALACAALGPTMLHTAVAAAAGTLFEAAPFVLAAELLPRRLGIVALAAGCGCGRRAPGAFSLAATGLCWIAFGPLVALGRLAVAVAIVRLRFVASRARRRNASAAAAHTRDAADAFAHNPNVFDVPRSPDAFARAPEGDDAPDAFVDLLTLAPCAALAALASSALGGLGAVLEASAGGRAVLLAAGLVLGIVSPCATAAVAIAAALATATPFAAAGVLITGGLVGLPQSAANANAPRSAICARVALTLALALLVARGSSGFVNPRLLPFAAAGILMAITGARRTTRSAAPGLVPALLLVALAAGSPPAPQNAAATRLEDAYPGEPIAFVGRSHPSGNGTVLERSFITCCRADASAVAVRMSARLRVPEGTWVSAAGVLVRSPDGLVLQPDRWRVIAAPADPFLYR